MGALKGKLNNAGIRIAPIGVQHDDETSRCEICQEIVGQETPDGIVESWSVLPCGHSFGSHCIKTWLGLADQPSCPMCRRDMVHHCGHPVLPIAISSRQRRRKSVASLSTRVSCRLDRKETGLDAVCPFCRRKRWARGGQGNFLRFVLKILSLFADQRHRNNLDNRYWEYWRDMYSAEYSTWWAQQEPATEAARPPQVKGFGTVIQVGG